MPNFDANDATSKQISTPSLNGLGGSPFKASAVTTVESSAEPEALLRLAAEILRDPLAMQQLCDRIYTLMQQDLKRQRERSGS